MITFVARNATVPQTIRAYHIVHCDRLASILKDGFLYSDSEIAQRHNGEGTVIGYDHIKARRLATPVTAGSDLTVGGCVPFYYCPRSVMLYVIWKRDSEELAYKGGQNDIVHLVFDPVELANWTQLNTLRYYVTDCTAACFYFTAYDDIDALNILDWTAINATLWRGMTDRKQAEFLVERCVPVSLLREVGVIDQEHARYVGQLLKLHGLDKQVVVNVVPRWYY